jgi:hypothetical protein
MLYLTKQLSNMPKRRFTKELLDEILQRDGATLIGEYKKITRDIRINYKCKCGLEYTKMMRYIDEEAGALCKDCGMKHMVETQKKYMIDTYGASHPMLVPEFKNKQEETMIANYGVSHNSHNPNTIQKRKDTLIEHFGVPHHFQLPEKIEERRETCRKNFGVDHHLQRDVILAKQRKTNLEKRGVEYSLQSKEVRAKGVATNLLIYGVEHPSQNQEVMERTQKNAKKYKEFKMPSGEIRMVQGYEPFALTDLLKVYTEEQIKTDRKDVPRIQYEVEGKKRYHFPDIFIPHEKKIVEVKSTWTYKCKTDNIQNKKKTAEEQGFLYEIWCYDKKGQKVSV